MPARRHKKTGLSLPAIDVLNVSIGTARYIDLNNQRNNRTHNHRIQNCVLKNVKSQTDLLACPLCCLAQR